MKYILGVVFIALAFQVNAASFGQQSESFSITETNSVGFFNFTLNMQQAVDIFAQGPENDAQIFLFSGLTPSVDGFIVSDDDGCPDFFCGASFGEEDEGLNSLIQDIILERGDYTVAVSDFQLLLDEAISGENLFVDPGDIVVTVRDAAPIEGRFVPVFADLVQIMQDIAQIEQEQEQAESTVRVTNTVVGNHVSEVISNVFGFGYDFSSPSSPSSPDIDAQEINLGGSSDGKGQSNYLPDAFWGKHVYTSLTEDGNNLGYATDLFQFVGGIDKRIDNFFVGSAVSYVYGDTKQAGNNSSSHSIGVTPYAAYRINSFLFASALAGYNYTSINGTEGRRDADNHNYNGEISLNAFKQIDSFLVKGRAGLRYTHNYTSLKGTIDADYDQLTWISDIEFGYHVNKDLQVFSGILYEYVDRESTVGTNFAAVSEAVHDGVVFFRGGLNYKINKDVSVGIDGSSDLNDEDNDILSFGANINIAFN